MTATPTPTPEGGGGWDPIGDLVNGGQGVIDGLAGTVGFWADPFGSMYNAAREAVTGLTQDFLPALTGATLPDLTADAFIDTYRVSFALSVLVAMVLLVVQLIRTARGTQSGRDTIQAIGFYFPGFILGVMFGPLAGVLIVNFVHGLTDSLLAWAYQGTAADFTGDMVSVLIDDPSMFAGGVAVAWMIAWAMVIGLLFVVILFVVQLVTLYFSGALIPLAAVWVVDPARRATGLRAIAFWVGLLLTHPLLFLLLGLAFRLIGNTITAWGSDGWKNLITLLVAVMAMWAAALSPFFLLKYVKSITEGAPASAGGSAGPAIGQRSLGQVAAQNSGGSQAAPAAAPAAQPVRGAAAPQGGRSLGQAAAARSGAAGGADSGRVVTAGVAGQARAGMAARAAGGVAATAAVTAAQKGYRGAKEAADTSVTPPQRETYGKDRL